MSLDGSPQQCRRAGACGSAVCSDCAPDDAPSYVGLRMDRRCHVRLARHFARHPERRSVMSQLCCGGQRLNPEFERPPPEHVDTSAECVARTITQATHPRGTDSSGGGGCPRSITSTSPPCWPFASDSFNVITGLAVRFVGAHAADNGLAGAAADVAADTAEALLLLADEQLVAEPGAASAGVRGNAFLANA
eukprot:7391491-Prymnesium_polylepis.2